MSSFSIDSRHMHQTDGEHDPLTSGVSDLQVVEPQPFRLYVAGLRAPTNGEMLSMDGGAASV